MIVYTAAGIAPGAGLLAGEDGGLVAVQLVRLRAASQGQVAEAFGVDPATIWRWDQALVCGRCAHSALLVGCAGPVTVAIVVP